VLPGDHRDALGTPHAATIAGWIRSALDEASEGEPR